MIKKTLCILTAVLMLAFLFAACSQENSEETENTAATEAVQQESTEEALSTEDSDDEDAAKEDSEEDGKNTDDAYPGELTNILLMGSMDGDFSDENNQNYALTHILITLDPENRTIRFTTFPYNLLVTPALDGDAEATQLQFVYAQYGAEVVEDTFSESFGIELDGYVIMNMHAVKSIVDELGGLSIKVTDLSVNDMADTVETLLGYVWREIEETGKQTLGGIQIIGYFMDTYHDLDEDNPTKDEEERFREKHEAIIDSLISAIKALGIDEAQAVELANLTSGDYITNIKESKWSEIAAMAIACTENEHEYFHVPQDIEVVGSNYLNSITYNVEDTEAIISFVYGEDEED